MRRTSSASFSIWKARPADARLRTKGPRGPFLVSLSIHSVRPIGLQAIWPMTQHKGLRYSQASSTMLAFVSRFRVKDPSSCTGCSDTERVGRKDHPSPVPSGALPAGSDRVRPTRVVVQCCLTHLDLVSAGFRFSVVPPLLCESMLSDVREEVRLSQDGVEKPLG
jgi:hypothetical protein